MKLAIIGSRDIDINISQYIQWDITEIISGGAKGVDTNARQYALENGIRLTELLPEYKIYGKQAPLVRNRTIVDCADMVLAIWDGKSRGTKFTIDYAKRKNKPVQIIII